MIDDDDYDVDNYDEDEDDAIYAPNNHKESDKIVLSF